MYHYHYSELVTLVYQILVIIVHRRQTSPSKCPIQVPDRKKSPSLDPTPVFLFLPFWA